jgi:hypothetical protein
MSASRYITIAVFSNSFCVLQIAVAARVQFASILSVALLPQNHLIPDKILTTTASGTIASSSCCLYDWVCNIRESIESVIFIALQNLIFSVCIKPVIPD